MTDDFYNNERTRKFAIQKARSHALNEGRQPGAHAYLPKTWEEAQNWMPHEWVIRAIIDTEFE